MKVEDKKEYTVNQEQRGEIDDDKWRRLTRTKKSRNGRKKFGKKKKKQEEMKEEKKVS